jgi:FlaA1/EpsC-like NDP-sugar epimerase
MIRYSTIELYDTLTYVVKGLQRPHKSFVLIALQQVVDSCLCFLAFLICKYFFTSLLPEAENPWWILTHAAPFIVVLCCSGIYRTFWLRAGIIQYYKLARLLGAAGIIGYILNCFVCVYVFKLPPEILWQYSGFYISYVLLIVVAVAGERFLLRYYESFGYRRLTLRNSGKNSEVERVVVYGGGFLCRMYVYRLYCGRRGGNVNIIGVVDDNPALVNLNVYGFNVLGTLEYLERVYRKTPFDAVVVTCRELSEEKFRYLLEFQKKHNVRIVRFSYSLDDLAPCGEE